MVWGKAGSTTTTGNVGNIDVNSMTASNFNTILYHVIGNGGTANTEFRVSSDSGTNYASRESGNGGADGTHVNDTGLPQAQFGANTEFVVTYMCNISGEEKLFLKWTVDQGTAGAGNFPYRRELAGKHITTAGQITDVEYYDNGGGTTIATDSNLSALGSDITPAAAVTFPSDVPDYTRFEETDTRKMYSLLSLSKSGCKAYYNFDSTSGGLVNQATSGNGFSDGLGSSADGVNTSVTLDTTNEKLGTGCYSLNGSSSKVVLGRASDWNFLSSATSNTWSIAWWQIYDDTLASGHTIMSTTDGSTQTDGMFIDNSGSGDIRLIQVDGNNGSWSSAIPDNTSWHHYVLTWNAGTVTLYVDGVSKGTQSQTAGSGTPQYGLNLGANNDEYYTALTLDDMSIWSRVLTSSEISFLYNSGTGSTIDNAKAWKEKGTT